MAALDIRMVAGELQVNTTALKALTDALSTAVDAVNTQTSVFVVDGLDAALPAALDVQAALADYEALNVSVSKPALNLNDSLTVIRSAE